MENSVNRGIRWSICPCLQYLKICCEDIFEDLRTSFDELQKIKLVKKFGLNIFSTFDNQEDVIPSLHCTKTEVFH